MIAVLPNSRYIGPLELVEAYEYFDGPKLFACRSLGGQLFLGLWVGASREGESYWLVALTPERYKMVRSGGLTLAHALSRPESGFIYRCTVAFADGETTTDVLLTEQIDPQLLPDPAEKLQLPTETLPSRIDQADLSRKAVEWQREVLGLHVDFGSLYREEAPAKGLGWLLVSTQETLDSLGQGIRGEATMRGAISPDILTATEARVVRAAGGSFALEISAAQSADLFGRSLIGDAIEKFLTLISLGNEVEDLRAMLIEIKPRAVSKYKVLLSTLVEYEGAVRLDWASPIASRNRSVSMDLVTAAAALRTVEQITSESGETISGLGVFVGVELPRKAFTVVMGDRTYRGRILPSAVPRAEHVTINAPYSLKIRETIEVTSSGEERLRYELEEIQDYNPGHIEPHSPKR
jgi:hypothetical protein